MILVPDLDSPKLIEMLQAGAIGVLRTDTLYGVVALASNQAAVERLYEVKQRDPSKSPIVLIADESQMFDPVPEALRDALAELWPGPNSVIIPSIAAPTWIKRDNGSVAYRQPDHAKLRRLLTAVGPLVAPSANPEGLPPAKSWGEAQGYFGDTVDFYVDGGVVFDEAPSHLYSFLAETGDLEQLR